MYNAKMRQFFTILFGGLMAIVFGVVIAYGGAVGWRALKPELAKIPSFSFLRAASIVVAPRADGTSISGVSRTIRYTASEEEDFINAATQALPSSSDKHVSGGAYLVKNLTRGDVTIEHNPDQLFPIASLAKLATAVVARKLIDPSERITVGKNVMAAYGNTANFKPGETFTAEDLLYPLLMVSSNDSAEAFALAYDRKKFISAMNDWSQSIGAYRTYFADPSGLSPDNVSTVNDLALILDWIRKNDPKIIEITALKTKTIRSHTWVNPTHFLSWSYYLGGKNGYTTEANRTSAALFALGQNKNVYAVIILDSDNRDADTVKLLAKVRE